MLERALDEPDPTVQETIWNAIVTALTTHELDHHRLAWDRVDAKLESLRADSLEHALTALGFTRIPAFRGGLEAFATHPNERIRECAREALDELSPPPSRKE